MKIDKKHKTERGYQQKDYYSTSLKRNQLQMQSISTQSDLRFSFLNKSPILCLNLK